MWSVRDNRTISFDSVFYSPCLDGVGREGVSNHVKTQHIQQYIELGKHKSLDVTVTGETSAKASAS